MSSRLRVKNIRDDLRISSVLNVCFDDPRIPAWLSHFQERALNRGRYWGSFQLMRLCVTSGCIILPREVAVIEAATLNGQRMTMGNMWYQFLRPHSDCDSTCSSSTAPCTGRVGVCSCCGCSPMVMEDRGTVPSFATTTGTNQRIRVYPGNAADAGKKILFQGTDKNGVWVRTTIDGARADGEQVVLAMPFVDTVTIWGAGAPTAVIKDATDYRVLVYGVDATTGAETAIADYQPSETEPMYRMVNIPGFSGMCGCSSSGTKTLLAVVSLQHIPLQHDNDWLIFQNLAAYKMGLQAEKYYEEGNIELGDAYFFGRDRAPRAVNSGLRHTYGMGALPELEAELRKQTGDKVSVDISFSTLNLASFR